MADTQRMTIEFPKDVHDKLGKIAEAERRSRTGELIDLVLERYDALKAAGKVVD